MDSACSIICRHCAAPRFCWARPRASPTSLQYLNVLVLDAESSTRSYFLSGRDSYLGPTKTVLTDSSWNSRNWKKLLADSPSQLKNLTQLQTRWCGAASAS
jgi:CHASE3 domain sensor protein